LLRTNADRSSFQIQFTNDIARYTGAPASSINVTGLLSGSTVVHFTLWQASYVAATARASIRTWVNALAATVITEAKKGKSLVVAAVPVMGTGVSLESSALTLDKIIPMMLVNQSYSWNGSAVICPSGCGLPVSNYSVNVTCVGSVYPVVNATLCNAIGRPPSFQLCPATLSCSTSPPVGPNMPISSTSDSGDDDVGVLILVLGCVVVVFVVVAFAAQHVVAGRHPGVGQAHRSAPPSAVPAGTQETTSIQSPIPPARVSQFEQYAGTTDTPITNAVGTPAAMTEVRGLMMNTAMETVQDGSIRRLDLQFHHPSDHPGTRSAQQAAATTAAAPHPHPGGAAQPQQQSTTLAAGSSPRTIDVTGSTSTGNFGITSPRRTVDATIPVSAAAPQQSERGGDASLRNMWARQLRVVQTGSDASSQVGASAAGGNVATAQAGGSVRRLSSQSPQQLLHVSRVFPSWNRSILTEI
jgi:hypothetical protein